MSENKKDYVVNLTSKNGDISVYNDLVKLKELGFADNYSTIKYRGVLVPAGLCEDSENFLVTYGAIVSGDQALLYDQISDSLSRHDAIHFLNVCAYSLKCQGREPFDKDDVENFLIYREQKNKMFQI